MYTVTDAHGKSLETFLWKAIWTNLNASSICGVSETSRLSRYTSWRTTGWRATYVWVAVSSLWYSSIPLSKFAGIQVALFTTYFTWNFSTLLVPGDGDIAVVSIPAVAMQPVPLYCELRGSKQSLSHTPFSSTKWPSGGLPHRLL